MGVGPPDQRFGLADDEDNLKLHIRASTQTLPGRAVAPNTQSASNQPFSALSLLYSLSQLPTLQPGFSLDHFFCMGYRYYLRRFCPNFQWEAQDSRAARRYELAAPLVAHGRLSGPRVQVSPHRGHHPPSMGSSTARGPSGDVCGTTPNSWVTYGWALGRGLSVRFGWTKGSSASAVGRSLPPQLRCQ